MTELVEFDAAMQRKINEFKSLSAEQRLASYWDASDNAELNLLKRHIKMHYLMAQDFTCAYCKQRIEVKHHAAWDTDHVIPKATHPQFMFDALNLCVSCKDCNGAKRDKNVLSNPERKTLPSGADDYIVCHPHLDFYEDHIKVVSLAAFYLPKTPKGAKTVEVCGLLRFVFQFSNYKSVPEQIKARLSIVHHHFMNAVTPEEQAFWLDCIAGLASEGKRAQQARVFIDLGIAS